MTKKLHFKLIFNRFQNFSYLKMAHFMLSNLKWGLTIYLTVLQQQHLTEFLYHTYQKNSVAQTPKALWFLAAKIWAHDLQLRDCLSGILNLLCGMKTFGYLTEKLWTPSQIVFLNKYIIPKKLVILKCSSILDSVEICGPKGPNLKIILSLKNSYTIRSPR